MKDAWGDEVDCECDMPDPAAALERVGLYLRALAESGFFAQFRDDVPEPEPWI